MTETDLSDWLPLLAAALQIRCSRRTVERLAQAGKLERRLRPQAGSPPVAVYNPDDVARLAAERQPAPTPFVLPAAPAGNGNGHRSTLRNSTAPGNSTALALPGGDDPIRQLAAAFQRFLLSPPSPPVAEAMAERRYLTVPEAADFTGLSQTFLKRMIKAGTLTAIKDRGWKIRRKDLEAL